MQDRFGAFTPIGIPSEPSVYSAMKLLRERREEAEARRIASEYNPEVIPPSMAQPEPKDRGFWSGLWDKFTGVGEVSNATVFAAEESPFGRIGIGPVNPAGISKMFGAIATGDP